MFCTALGGSDSSPRVEHTMIIIQHNQMTYESILKTEKEIVIYKDNEAKDDLGFEKTIPKLLFSFLFFKKANFKTII